MLQSAISVGIFNFICINKTNYHEKEKEIIFYLKI